MTAGGRWQRWGGLKSWREVRAWCAGRSTAKLKPAMRIAQIGSPSVNWMGGINRLYADKGPKQIGDIYGRMG